MKTDYPQTIRALVLDDGVKIALEAVERALAPFASAAAPPASPFSSNPAVGLDSRSFLLSRLFSFPIILQVFHNPVTMSDVGQVKRWLDEQVLPNGKFDFVLLGDRWGDSPREGRAGQEVFLPLLFSRMDPSTAFFLFTSHWDDEKRILAFFRNIASEPYLGSPRVFGIEKGDRAGLLLALKLVFHATSTRAQMVQRAKVFGADLDSPLPEADLFPEMVGSSPGMRQVYDLVEKYAPSAETVLITGESGTGKELVARAIHQRSSRAKGRFVGENCSAIQETLSESALFGHEKGAFTGALRRKKGLFEMAHNGTLFLDEVGELPPWLQTKLLRVLEERTFHRVGGEDLVRVDTRVVCATNKDLKEEVRQGRFREDLFYRLHVLPIYLPSLSERGSDITALARFFLDRCSGEGFRGKRVLSEEVLAFLRAYPWPGNVRELQSCIKRMVLTFPDEPTLGLEHLPSELSLTGESFRAGGPLRHPFEGLLGGDIDARSLATAINWLERLEAALMQLQGEGKLSLRQMTMKKVAEADGCKHNNLSQALGKYRPEIQALLDRFPAGWTLSRQWLELPSRRG